MASATGPLLTYSMVKALYDQGADYVDSFWPFLLHVLPPDGTHLPLVTIGERVLDRFGLRIPQHTLRTIAERARRRRGFLEREGDSYGLAGDGQEYLRQSETERDAQRRITALIGDANVFLQDRYSATLTHEQTKALIEKVIQGNVALFDFLVDKPPSAPLAGTNSLLEDAVLAYFKKVDEEQPQVFATLRDLICGTVISGLLRRTDIADATRHFRKTTLYLDTNIVLSLLDLRFPAQTRPTQELFQLIMDAGYFELAVLSITYEEIVELLRGYQIESRLYEASPPVDSIYTSMRARNLSVGDMRELVAALPSRLDRLGITLIKGGVTLDSVLPPDRGRLEQLASYKPDQPRRGQLHDLHAIDLVRQQRKHIPTRVEDARFFFLTEDVRLSNYAYQALGHKAQETVSEVMPDRLLTNLLWLKRPQTLQNISLGSIIAMHSRDLFINRGVWTRFHQLVEELAKQGEVADEAASLLIYDGQVHRDLALLGANQTGSIDREWILGRLRQAAERNKQAREAELDAQRTALRRGQQESEAALKHQFKVLQQAATLHVDEISQASRSADNILRVRAKRYAHFWVVAIRSAFAVVLGVTALETIPRLLERWDIYERWLNIVPTVVGVALLTLGVQVNIANLWVNLEHAIAERYVKSFASDMRPLREALDNAQRNVLLQKDREHPSQGQ